jgi:hypothetical protein
MCDGSPFSLAERLVALVIAESIWYAKRDTGRYESVLGLDEIARRSGMCEKTVRTALKGLCGGSGARRVFVVEKKIRARTRKTDGRGRKWPANHYILAPEIAATIETEQKAAALLETAEPPKRPEPPKASDYDIRSMARRYVENRAMSEADAMRAARKHYGISEPITGNDSQ